MLADPDLWWPKHLLADVGHDVKVGEHHTLWQAGSSGGVGQNQDVLLDVDRDGMVFIVNSGHQVVYGEAAFDGLCQSFILLNKCDANRCLSEANKTQMVMCITMQTYVI